MARRVLIVVLFLSLLPSAWFFFLQGKEERAVAAYLETAGLADLPLTKETAFAVSDRLRSEFNTEEPTFRALDMAHRPFLREDARWLLEHKEGLCGEGTRVLVVLLRKLGFDATRISLYNRRLYAAHTLASVRIGDREFLVDSINSGEEFNHFLRTTDVSPVDFPILHYSGNIAVRRNATAPRTGGFWDTLFRQYPLYSYEAVPATKLLGALSVDARFFNFERPPGWVSGLAEKPNLITALVLLILAVFVDLVAVIVYGVRRRRAPAP